MRSQNLNIFIIAIVIIVVIRVIANLLKKVDGSGLQDKIKRFFANLENYNSNQDVVIYDENGKVMNFQNSDFSEDDSQDVVIYDENGKVISLPPPPPPPVYKPEKETEVSRTVFVEEVEREEEPEADAEVYHDFIRSNGGSAIVIQEILGKPLALRHTK